MTHPALSFVAKSYFRRLRFYWPFWLSTVGAVALVGIGSALPDTFRNAPPMRGLDSAKAAAILEACAIVVAAVQVSIMSLRALLADTRYFRTLFSMGATPIVIAVMRAAEMFIGCVLAISAGLCVVVLTLNQLFGVPITAMTVSGMSWLIIVGMIPVAFTVLVPKLATTPH